MSTDFTTAGEATGRGGEAAAAATASTRSRAPRAGRKAKGDAKKARGGRARKPKAERLVWPDGGDAAFVGAFLVRRVSESDRAMAEELCEVSGTTLDEWFGELIENRFGDMRRTHASYVTLVEEEQADIDAKIRALEAERGEAAARARARFAAAATATDAEAAPPTPSSSSSHAAVGGASAPHGVEVGA